MMNVKNYQHHNMKEFIKNYTAQLYFINFLLIIFQKYLNYIITNILICDKLNEYKEIN